VHDTFPEEEETMPLLLIYPMAMGCIDSCHVAFPVPSEV